MAFTSLGLSNAFLHAVVLRGEFRIVPGSRELRAPHSHWPNRPCRQRSRITDAHGRNFAIVASLTSVRKKFDRPAGVQEHLAGGESGTANVVDAAARGAAWDVTMQSNPISMPR